MALGTLAADAWASKCQIVLRKYLRKVNFASVCWNIKLELLANYKESSYLFRLNSVLRFYGYIDEHLYFIGFFPFTDSNVGHKRKTYKLIFSVGEFERAVILLFRPFCMSAYINMNKKDLL
jgi:hypothetical protein